MQAINLKYAQKNEEIFKGSEGKFAKFKSLKSSQKEKNKEMKAVLDKDQYKKYEAMTEEMKAKAREQYKTRQGVPVNIKKTPVETGVVTKTNCL